MSTDRFGVEITEDSPECQCPDSNIEYGIPVLHCPRHGEMARQDEHRAHMTDGRWHDDCPYCLRRRRHGGTGLEGR